MTLARPLLLDATFLVAYERDLTRRAQALVVEAIADGRILVVPTASLLSAGTELAGTHPELSWLLDDAAGPVQVLPLTGTNALHVAEQTARTGSQNLAALEVAHVVHEASSINAVVLTYEPKLYADYPSIDVIDIRPQ